MMLHQLIRYGRDKGLMAEPGFCAKQVKWALLLDPKGSFLEVLELGEPSNPHNRGLDFPRCPNLNQPEILRGGKGCRHFLVDSVAVLTLLGSEDDPKLVAQHDFFVELLRQASPFVPELATASVTLSDPAVLAEIRSRLEAARARPTETATLAFSDGEISFPVNSDSWHQWWQEFRTSLAPQTTGSRMRCLATGELVRPLATHDKVRHLSGVGANPVGASLISFDKRAFASYGLSQGANAAISAVAGKAYVEALNHVLQHQSGVLWRTRSERERSGPPQGAVVAYWYRGPVAESDDVFADLLGNYGQGREEEDAAVGRARRLLESLHRGERPELLDSTFYTLTLSGAGGRVMIRDWLEGSFESLALAVDAWFRDFEVLRPDGGGLAPPPHPYAVLTAVVREGDDPPSPLAAALWRAAVGGLRLPRSILAPALVRFRSGLLQKSPVTDPVLAGLFKAYHQRNSPGEIPMEPELYEDHPSPAYQCGRLLALLAAIQNRALPGVGAGVVQRYYAAASATPALVLGRLIRTSHFHLGKLEDGLAYFFEGRVAEVIRRIGPRVPSTLSLEEQSLFALGYYQQVATDRADRAEWAARNLAAGEQGDPGDTGPSPSVF